MKGNRKLVMLVAGYSGLLGIFTYLGLWAVMGTSTLLQFLMHGLVPGSLELVGFFVYKSEKFGHKYVQTLAGALCIIYYLMTFTLEYLWDGKSAFYYGAATGMMVGGPPLFGLRYVHDVDVCNV